MKPLIQANKIRNFSGKSVSSCCSCLRSLLPRLKFDHTKLSQRSHDVLASLTEEELDMLYSIHQKAKKGGIKHVEMF